MTRAKGQVAMGVVGRLKARMAELGLSIGGLAAASNIPKSTIGHYCAGTCPVDGWAADKLGQWLGVSTSWLLTGEGPKVRACGRKLTPLEMRIVKLRRRDAELASERKKVRAELRRREAEHAAELDAGEVEAFNRGEP